MTTIGPFRDKEELCGVCGNKLHPGMYDGVNVSSKFHPACWARITNAVLEVVKKKAKEKAAANKEAGVRCKECGGLSGPTVTKFFVRLGVFLVVMSIVVALGALIYASITADGTIDHCYIRFQEAVVGHDDYILEGSVDWAPDRELTRASTLDEAIAAADRLHCPVR